MKCSSCNGKVKPVVAIDIDGTLGEYHQYFMLFFQNYYDVIINDPYEGATTFKDHFLIRGYTIDQYRQAKLAYRQGGMKRVMTPYPGAGNLVKTVMELGGEVWLCTTRPYLRLDNIDPDTREWLRRWNIPYDGLIYGEDKYRRLVDTVGENRIVAVFDDLPEMVDECQTLGLPVWQMARDHNQRPYSKREPRVLGCAAAAQVASERIEEWYMRNTQMSSPPSNKSKTSSASPEKTLQLELPLPPLHPQTLPRR